MARPIVLATIVASLLATSVSAATLQEALAATYRTNPQLNAQREALKSTDAGVGVARASGRPQVISETAVTRDIKEIGSLRDEGGKGPYLESEASLSLPIYSGGRVGNQVAAAKARVEAGRATLRAAEGSVFLEAVTAYMDVVRDRAIATLRNNNVKVLEKNLESARDRFRMGDLTLTDVAQSEARLAQSQADLALARDQLTSSVETYRRVIGVLPDELEPSPPLPALPITPDDAVRIALVGNANLAASTHEAQAAGFDVGAARAGRLPTLSATATGNYENTLSGATVGEPRTGTQLQVGVESDIPIYQGGRISAQIRQRQALEGQAQELLIGTERSVIAETRSAFAEYQSAKEAIASGEASVSASEFALEGARAENSVGTRTVLDVLNAEQELLDAQVTLVTARRNVYVAGFRLLRAMGQAEADKLGLTGPYYDPLANYRRVAGDLNDWSSDRRHEPKSTRTGAEPE